MSKISNNFLLLNSMVFHQFSQGLYGTTKQRSLNTGLYPSFHSRPLFFLNESSSFACSFHNLLCVNFHQDCTPLSSALSSSSNSFLFILSFPQLQIKPCERLLHSLTFYPSSLLNSNHIFLNTNHKFPIGCLFAFELHHDIYWSIC